MNPSLSNFLTILLNSLWSITKLLSIIYIINTLTIKLQPLSQQIFTQNFVTNQQKDKQVISFHSLLLIQKIVIFITAYVLIAVLRYFLGSNNSSSKKSNDHGETVDDEQHHMEMEITHHNGNNKNNINNNDILNSLCHSNPIPIKHQLLIGLCSTISILLFVQSQYTLFPQQLSYMKHMGLFVIFVIINYWFLDYFEVMRIPFFCSNTSSNNKWSIFIFIVKYLYLILKSVQFYYLSRCAQIIVRNNIPYDHYYGMWFQQFSTLKFDDFSFSTKWDLWLAIGLEGLGYAIIFWARGNYLNTEAQQSTSSCVETSFDNLYKNNSNTNSTSTSSTTSIINTTSIITTFISTLQMTLTFVKFSIITLIAYSIFVAGDFKQTVSYLKDYPQSYYILAKYGLMNFIICFSYAYCVVGYSPSVFLTVFVTRRVFERFQQRYQDGGFRESLQGVIKVLALVCLQLVVYQWFASRQHRSNSYYDKVNEKVIDQPSAGGQLYSYDKGQRIQMVQTNTQLSSSIGIHDDIVPNYQKQKLNFQQQQQ